MMHHLGGGDGMVARKVTTNSADRLTVTLDAEDKAELERLSKEMDRSVAWFVRDALSKYLKDKRGRAHEGAR
ncbi:ribbon-helix-helix domain-containing protein [Mesorhizobium sp. M0142]|uniref:ribbon-helix-helix domain-containing protein n=1 Tax=Mesorhizobium sp. M0142 TaxID=2956894 RepID=UPI00333BEFF8